MKLKKTDKNIILFFLLTAVIGIMRKSKTRKAKNNQKFLKNNEEKDENKLIYINIDGLSYDLYEKANKRPLTQTTNIDSLINNGALFTNAFTGIPSITGPMQQSIVSGAWPIDTGNCYRYYDLAKDQVVQHTRENKLENIAEAANRNGINFIGINSWYFEKAGKDKNRDNIYIESREKNGYKGRFKALKEVLKDGASSRFISIYLDDIDGAAHNSIGLKTREEVEGSMISLLKNIDTEIGEVIEILKDKEAFDKTNFVITTDHGAVAFGADTREQAQVKDYAYSQLPDLLETISRLGKKHVGEGFEVEMVNKKGDKAKKSSHAIVTTAGLQAQIKFRKHPSREFLEEIISNVKNKAYYGTHLTGQELELKGVPQKFADLLISPKPPYHFKHNFNQAYFAVNQHDSLDEKAQKIFSLVAGPSFKDIGYYDKEIHNINMSPTMARILGFEGPKGASVSALDDVLVDYYRGPKLKILSFEENIKRVGYDVYTESLSLETEPASKIIINRKTAGISDENGYFKTWKDLKPGVNRFIIESIKNGKTTRRTVFLIKREVDKDE